MCGRARLRAGRSVWEEKGAAAEAVLVLAACGGLMPAQGCCQQGSLVYSAESCLSLRAGGATLWKRHFITHLKAFNGEPCCVRLWASVGCCVHQSQALPRAGMAGVRLRAGQGRGVHLSGAAFLHVVSNACPGSQVVTLLRCVSGVLGIRGQASISVGLETSLPVFPLLTCEAKKEVFFY